MKKNKEIKSKTEENPRATSEADKNKNESHEKMTLGGIDLNEFVPEEMDAQITKKIKPTKIPIGRRDEQTWIQYHSSWEFRLNCIKRKADRTYFVVQRAALPYSQEWVKAYKFFVGITQQNTIFLLDIPEEHEGDKGFGKSWHESAYETVLEGRDGWIQVRPKSEAGGYEVLYPQGVMKEPVWPEISKEEILNIAFRDRIITDGDHEFLRELRGQQPL